jgi:hypothetical protein
MVAVPKSASMFSPAQQLAPALSLVRDEAHASAPLLSGTARIALRKVLTGLHATAGIAGIVGGAMLVAQPSGAALGLTTAELSAFTSFLIPGIVLGVLGFLQLVAAVWSTKPGASPMEISHYAGALLVLFVAFQTALVQPILPIAAVMAGVGFLIYTLSHELHRDEPHTPLLP